MKRDVFLHIESGISKSVDISPDSKSRFESMETELTWLRNVGEESIREILLYDKADQDMDSTNEKTKHRVFNSSSISMFLLIALGAWEIYYLHSFFKAKHLI